MEKQKQPLKQTNIFFSFLFALLLLSGSNLFAQISEGGTPPSFSNRLSSDLPTVFMPSVNVEALLAEDEAEQSKDVPFRFGEPIDVDYTLNNSGLWEELPDGSRIWRLRISSPGAFSLNLTYEKYRLPEGAKLFLYNDDRSSVLGAYTSFNNKESMKFSTSPTAGDAVTLEYFEPANVLGQGVVEVSIVVHAYKNLFGHQGELPEGFGSSGSCNNNVNCPEGEPWANQKRSVAMILTSGGSRICSGSLVNNVRQDLAPLFLTANHCLGGNDTWIFMFNYESPNCNNIDGPTNYTVQGSTLLAKNSSSDFGLLLLNEAPPTAYNVHFAGWSAIDVASTNSVGIHHPAGDIKKISWDYDPSTSSDYDPSPYLPNSHWEITAWNDGTTEPGSSGSPLYDQNGRVIGQLHGGWASCTSITQDYYGKFSMSWSYGTTPATRLKDWLDPDNTGTLVLDGWDPTMGDPDYTPPTPVTDLAISDITSTEMTLSWTAPYDSSFGGVRAYDIRISTSAINDTIDFANATPLTGFPTPAPTGTTQTFLVADLDFSTTYYYAIRSRDMWNNWSLLSNVPMASSYDAPVAVVSPTSVNVTLPAGASTTRDINLANSSATNSTLDYSVSLENNTFPEPTNIKLTVIPQINSAAKSYEDKDNAREMPGVAIEGFGGPDVFGYQWIDSDEPNGPQYVWNDISTTGTEVTTWLPTGTFGAKDEGYAGPIALGSTVKFYGVDYDEVYFSSNGLISFLPFTANNFSNSTIPTASGPQALVAAVWDDLDGTSSGQVFYQTVGNKFIVQYEQWGEYSGSGLYTFQIVLYTGGKVEIFYKSLSGDLVGSTVGIENETGTVGLQVAYNATYLKNNLALRFAAEPEWLTLQNGSGRIYNGNSIDVELTFLTEDNPEGDYSMDVVFTTNDPAHPEIVVPVQFTLGQGSGAWMADLSVNDAGGTKAGQIVTFGQAPGATDGLDPLLGEYELPPTPPLGVFDARFVLSETISSLKDIRGLEQEAATWQVKFQPGEAGYPIVLSWNPEDLGDGSFMLKDQFGGMLVNLDMTQTNSYSLTNTAITSLLIEYSSQMNVTMNVNAGWNIISVPVSATDMSVTGLFPEAISSAYAFDNGYTTVSELSMGEGYWLKFQDTHEMTMSGMPYAEAVALSQGWNIVGPYNWDVPVSSIVTVPAGIISSSFYGFDNGYSTAQTLAPGKGYWVKASEAGEMTFGSAAKSGSSVGFAQIPQNSGKIVIEDASMNRTVLYVTNEEINLSQYDLPPVPPAGIFDARFSNDRSITVLNGSQSEIRLNSVQYPVRVRVENADLQLADLAGGKLLNTLLRSGEEVILKDASINSFSVNGIEIPTEFRLSQNYPNPFNPSTTISFGLPADSRVSIIIYDMVGQKVMEINAKEYKAGNHEVSINAGTLSSGIYFYNFIAEGTNGTRHSDTKKMMLMK